MDTNSRTDRYSLSSQGIKLRQQLLAIPRAIVLHNFLRIAPIDDISHLLKLAPLSLSQVLHLSQPTRLNERRPPRRIIGQNLTHLLQHQLHHTLSQRFLHKLVQRREMGQLAYHPLQRPPALVSQIFAVFVHAFERHHVEQRARI